MKKIKLIELLLLIISLFFALSADAAVDSADEISVSNASGEIYVVPGKTAAAVIAVRIPDAHYIYANPKGPGIGRATEVSVVQNDLIEAYEARYPEGEEYLARGDTSPVYIYRKSVRLPFAFTIKNNARPGEYSLKVKVSILMCTSDACIPVEKNVDIAVRVRSEIQGSAVVGNLDEFLSLKKNINAGSAQLKTDQVRNTGIAEAGGAGIPESIKFTPDYSDGDIAGIFEAILLGLIAGFILNFMPCVLPVVSLKIMSFVINAGEKRKVIVTQGFLFSAGIIASFLVLAGLAAFSGYKWGALFQEKFFLIIMATFIFSMALSLFGVFTFNVPLFAGRAVSKTHGIYTDAFIKGAMATLLATPCSGPFLGGTLAWSLTRPPEIIFIIFISVGFGMALPYMMLVLSPSLIKKIPKPGDWMINFEKAMGFILMFTVVYLIGILDNTVRMGSVLFLLFVAVGLWQFGIYGSADRERWKRWISFAVMLAVFSAGYLLSFEYFYSERNLSGERNAFSSAGIMKNRDNGIITVVEFTAEWCPNCSLVEKISLEKEKVRKLFARNDVEFMVADITQKHTEAESLMNRLGSRSIPLLAVFPPGEGFSSPYCLRDIYSADDVADAVGKAEKFITGK